MQTLFARFSVLAANLVGGIITARWLGPENLGIYYLLVILPQMAFRFGNLGFGSAFAFFAARSKASNRDLFGLVWTLGLIIGMLSGLVFLAVRPVRFSPWHDIDVHLFYLFLPAVPLCFWTLYSQRMLSGKLKITALNISVAISGFGMLAFQVLFVVILDWGLRGALIAALVSMVLTCLYLFWQTILLVGKVDVSDQRCKSKALIGELWRYGRWNYLVMFTDFLYTQLPLLALKYFFSNYIVGFFSLARGLEQKTQLLTMPFSEMLFPFTAASEKDDAIRRTNMLCRLTIVGMLILTSVLFLVIRVFILLLYGQAYLPAVNVFYALAPGIFIWPLGQFLTVHTASSGKPKLTFFANIGPVVMAVVVCWLLIPRYGAVGGGLSVSIIYATRTFFQLLVYIRIAGSSLAEVFLPRKSDWTYFHSSLKVLASEFIKKAK